MITQRLSSYFHQSFSSGMLSLLLLVAAGVIAVIALLSDEVWVKALVLAYVILP